MKKIDISKGSDVNKSSASNKCMFFHFWFFKNVGYNFERMFVINVIMY